MGICFFCGSEDLPPSHMSAPNSQSSAFHSWKISCVSSVSAALGLSMTASIQLTMTRQAKYCEPCLGLMRDIDFFTRSLRRIQSGLSSKTAILRRQIQRNCERLASSSQKPVPGSREFVLRTLVESTNIEGVQHEENKQEETSPWEAPGQDSNKSRSVQHRLSSMLRRGRPKKSDPVTRNRVTNCMSIDLDRVKEEEVEDMTEMDVGTYDEDDMGNETEYPKELVSGIEQSDESEGDEDYVPLASFSDDKESLLGEVEDYNIDASGSPVERKVNLQTRSNPQSARSLKNIRQCVVPMCKSVRGKSQGLSFHEFPSDQDVRKVWLKNIARQASKSSTTSWVPEDRSIVCSLHFERSCYLDGRKQRRLKHCSVPTAFSQLPARLKSKIVHPKQGSHKRKAPAPRQVTTGKQNKLIGTLNPYINIEEEYSSPESDIRISESISQAVPLSPTKFTSLESYVKFSKIKNSSPSN